jgi:hypothetical protein
VVQLREQLAQRTEDLAQANYEREQAQILAAHNAALVLLLLLLLPPPPPPPAPPC